MRNQKALLEDILSSIEIINDALKSVSEAQLKGDKILQDGIIRRFAIIGEASKNISPIAKANHKEVNWRSLAGMRDFLVHEYFDIDIEIVWNSIKSDLPILKKTIKEMMEELQK